MSHRSLGVVHVKLVERWIALASGLFLNMYECRLIPERHPGYVHINNRPNQGPCCQLDYCHGRQLSKPASILISDKFPISTFENIGATKRTNQNKAIQLLSYFFLVLSFFFPRAFFGEVRTSSSRATRVSTSLLSGPRRCLWSFWGNLGRWWTTSRP